MKQYVVDAFADKLFSGNPAAVCVLEEPLSDELMLSIARENNLSETAFAVKRGEAYHLRWFTPGGEIDLCGHATLGTAFVILNFYEKSLSKITFTTLSGELTVLRHDDLYEMNFPAYQLTQVPVTAAMEKALGVRPIDAYIARDLLCVLPEGTKIAELVPDMSAVCELDGLLLNATVKGSDYDCESRSFAPKLNVNEDPVCGSGHCHIVPYWTKKLEKNILVCHQASPRGGVLYCEQVGDRIKMSGKVVLYSVAELSL